MNADDVKSLMQQSLTEGGADTAGAPATAAIAARVRATRQRRTLTVVAGAAATVALVGVIVWQAGAFSAEPIPPATPTTTGGATQQPTTETPSAEDPTTGASEEPPTNGGAPVSAAIALPDVSDAVFGECGESYEAPARTSALVVENGPTGAMPATGGGWAATVTNTGDELIQAPVALTQLTIVDGDGRVVATPDPDSDIFLGAEGPRWMGLAAGSSLETRIAIPGACATGDWLPSGDYQAYGAITFVDGDRYEQAQGGPWPLTIGGGPETDLEVTVPPGTVPADLECGATWADPQPSTGFALELIDDIRSPREATDDIVGRAAVAVAAPIDTTVYTEVVVLRDGVIVNHMPGTDAAVVASATAGTALPVDFDEGFLDCDVPLTEPAALSAGEYEVVVVVMAGGAGSAEVLAATDRIPVELT